MISNCSNWWKKKIIKTTRMAGGRNRMNTALFDNTFEFLRVIMKGAYNPWVFKGQPSQENGEEARERIIEIRGGRH